MWSGVNCLAATAMCSRRTSCPYESAPCAGQEVGQRRGGFHGFGLDHALKLRQWGCRRGQDLGDFRLGYAGVSSVAAKTWTTESMQPGAWWKVPSGCRWAAV